MKISNKLFTTFFLNIALFMVSFIVSIIISRFLGPENLGIYRFVLLIASSIVLFGNVGIPEILQLRLAQKKITLNQYLKNTLFFCMPMFFVFVSVIYFIFRDNLNIYEKSVMISVVLYCLTFQLNSIFHNALFAMDKIIKFQVFDIARQLSFLTLVTFFFYFNKLSLDIVFWILVFVNLISFSYVSYLNIINKQSVKDDFLFSVDLFKEALKIYISNIFAFLTYRIDLYILKIYVSFYEIGLYTMAVSLAEKIWIFPESIRSVVYLELTNKRHGEEFLSKLLRILTAVIVIVGFILAFSSFYIIPLIFSDKYILSVLPFLLLLPGVMVFCYTKVLASYFVARDLITINTFASGIIIAVNISLNFLLIPSYGIRGAAIATTFAYLSGAIYHINKYKNTTKSTFSDLLILKKTDMSFAFDLVKRKLIK